jgi:hypothetical protein
MDTWDWLYAAGFCRDWNEVYDQLSGFRGDVWMNGWVLKKRSKDVLEELAVNIKNIKPKNYNICMYVFIM